MTAKVYLQQIYSISMHIKRLQDRRDQIRADLFCIGSVSGEMNPDKVISSISGDNMVKLIAQVDDIERRIVSELEELQAKRDKIAHEIERLPNEKHREILHYRYIMCHKWDEIADIMGISLRYVYIIHGHALVSFEKTLG